jgi:hypothetical protein
MRESWMKRPTVASAALVVSVAAMVVALSGGAIGLPGKATVDNNDLRKNVVKSKHVAKDALTGGDVRESSLAEVPTAGAPFAYALVVDPVIAQPTGVTEARSKGMTDAMVTDSGVDGKTCFDLPFAISGAQVTVDYAAANNEFAERTAQFAIGDPYTNCPAPFKDAVVTVALDTGPGVDLGFYIAFYR